MKSKPLVHDNSVTLHEFTAPDREPGVESEKTPTLGVVAICRNEQRDLAGFLEHLLPWVDEIVLVDDGSTDDTLKIARSAGPKISIISSPRLPGEYFSHQRNKGIRSARSDWLLHMDIDERVPPELRREIEAGIRRSDVDGFRFRRHNFFLHRPIRGGGWQLWSYLHVARREKFMFGGKIHEECHLSSEPDRVKRFRSLMWHFNEDCYEKRRRKSLFYTTVEAETLLQKNVRVGLFHLIVVPFLVFIKRYILLLGFRDGIAGWILAFEGMVSTFDAFAMAWDQQNRIAREDIEASFDTLKTEAGLESMGRPGEAASSFKTVCNGLVDAPPGVLFSLIVCTRGRTQELNCFFESIINQLGDTRCQIIVVDQNIDGRLDPIIEAYRGRVQIERIRSPAGLSRGRNLALRYVRGSVVAFPDDDCVYPNTLLNDVWTQLVTLPTADGVSVMSRDFDGRASGPRWNPKAGWITKNQVFRQAISYGLFFRAGLVRQVGAFDESLGIGSESSWQSGEETDYVLRALAQGYRIFYYPRLFSFHARGRKDESGFRKQVTYAAGGGRVVRLHSFSWMFRLRFFAAPFLRAILNLFRLAPGHSKWQLDIGLARWRGFCSGRFGRAYSSLAGEIGPEPERHVWRDQQ